VTEGLPAALAAPGVLAIAEAVAETVQAVQVAWVPSVADARAGVAPAGLVGKLVHLRAPVLECIVVKIYRDMLAIYR
jgi:hypothetical protein